MISAQEIRTVTFDKTMRGYRAEDVDAFLQQVAQDMEQLAADNADKEKKLYILAEKVEEYRRDEDNLKTALLNAQRMGENVIREAKQKAESMLREAGIRADTLTRVAKEQVEDQAGELERVKAEVADFKNKILGMYRQHIELLSALPDDEQVEALAEEPAFQTQEAEQPDYSAVQAQPETKAEPQEVQTESGTASQFPDLSELYSEKSSQSAPEEVSSESVEDVLGSEFEAEGFQAQSFSENTESEQSEEQFASNEETVFQGFKGIKFSD